MATELFIYSTGTVIVCALIVIYTKYFMTQKSKKTNQRCLNKLIDGLLQQLRKTQLYPLSPDKGWLLSTVLSGYRQWHRTFTYDTRKYRVEGCCCKVPASAQVVLRYLRDPTTIKTWLPDIHHHTTINATENLPSELLKTETHQDKLLIQKIPPLRMAFRLLARLTGNDKTTYRRLWLRENNGCCWMLFYNVNNHTWIYFLSQPIEDVARSMLSILTYNSTYFTPISTQAPVLLRSISDMLYLRKSMVTPLLPGNDVVHSSFPKSKFARQKSAPSPTEKTSPRRRAITAESISNNSSNDSIYAEPETTEQPTNSQNHVQRVNNSINTQRQQEVKNISNGNVVNGGDSTTKINEKNTINVTNNNSTVITKATTTNDIKSLGAITLAENSIGGNSQNPVENNRNSNGKPPLKKTESYHSALSRIESTENNNDNSIVDNTPHNISKATLYEEKVSDDESASESESFSDDAEEAEESDDEGHNTTSLSTSYEFDSSGAVIVPHTDEQKKNKEIKRLHFACNQAAAELQTLVLDANNIDLSEQSENARGPQDWIFCAVEQDVIVMKRTFKAKNARVISYLGKGLVEAAPHLVWDTVRNPRTRFAYDETLKKVDIVSVVEDSIKIVYYYHEVVQLFRKGSCDFTLAQKERQDNDTYILSMHSCPGETGHNHGAKVTILPTGWFLERVVKDGQVCTMVNYITQAEIPSSMKAALVTLVDELMSKQPLAIIQLRDYLRPFSHFCIPKSAK